MDRMTRVNELVKQQLAIIIREELEMPKGVVLTILKVEVSRDLHYAKVFVSVLPEDKIKDVLSLLISSSKDIQYELAEKIEMRHTPKLRFIYDETEAKAQELEELLDNLE